MVKQGALQVTRGADGEHFLTRRISQEVSGDALGEVCLCSRIGFNGVLDALGEFNKRLHSFGRNSRAMFSKSRGGCDNQEFAMKQGPSIASQRLVLTGHLASKNMVGATETEGGKKPRMGRPKRVSKIHKIFNLSKEDDRKRARIAEKKKRISKAKVDAAEYQKLLAQRLKEQRERHSESLAKKRSRPSVASKPSIAA
ncbi:40S ribosomal protein S6-1-like [Durio zibethinus]|uniref:40S ribosomal protein S6-1-like n=1 Tax=Durio zibethinus TaxID=66656 RepID=A0A6P6AM40_DURZI|nr:40S ribosomal protein S6-1-like [Durio zibethinus]